MKKLLLSGLSVLLFIPFTSFAMSGACSNNGGVMCISGATFDGNARCNNGSESTIPYADINECTTSDHSCTSSDWNNINLELNIPVLQKSVQDLNFQLTQTQDTYINQNLDPYKDTDGTVVINPIQEKSLVNSLITKIATAQIDLKLAQDKAQIKCTDMGEQESADKQNSIVQPVNIEQSNQNQIKMDAYCTTKGGTNYNSSTGVCNCNLGVWSPIYLQCLQTSQPAVVNATNTILNPIITTAPIPTMASVKVPVQSMQATTTITTQQDAATSMPVIENIQPNSPPHISFFAKIGKFFGKFKFW